MLHCPFYPQPSASHSALCIFPYLSLVHAWHKVWTLDAMHCPTVCPRVLCSALRGNLLDCATKIWTADPGETQNCSMAHGKLALYFLSVLITMTTDEWLLWLVLHGAGVSTVISNGMAAVAVSISTLLSIGNGQDLAVELDRGALILACGKWTKSQDGHDWF